MTHAWQTEHRVTHEPWPYNPEQDAPWADPAAPRWQIGTDPEQLKHVADAIIAGEQIEHAEIADLRALIEAVQAHPKAVLQVLETYTVTDDDGIPTEFLRASGVECRDDVGNRVFTPLSELDVPMESRQDPRASVAATRAVLHECIIQQAKCSDFDTRCTLVNRSHFVWANFDGARFAEWASFDAANFAAVARFDAARFAGRASFDAARFADRASFDRASFAEGARLDRASFAAGASFIQARFAERASFIGASFAEGASFLGARFAERASFDRASFAEGASFLGARLAGLASFYEARFAAGAGFIQASFAEGASFIGASFAERASFDRARFAAGASIDRASFAEDASFIGASFAEGASFYESRFIKRASFDRASFAEGASFDRARFESAPWFSKHTRFQGSVSFESAEMNHGFDLGEARCDGPIVLTGLTLSRRLEAKDARLGPNARLAMNNLLPLAGGTLEFSQQQIRRVAPPGHACNPFGRLLDRLDAWLAPRLGWKHNEEIWWSDRTLAGIASWFVMHPRGAFILGEDARDPNLDERVKALKRAAEDYELLAANYRNQPATDHDEDWCRWRAHELRRVAWFTQTRADLAKALRPLAVIFCWSDPPEPMDELPSLGRSIGAVVGWFTGLLTSIIVLIGIDVLLKWFIQRQCLGYLLQTHRILATMGAVVLGFTALYATGVGPDTITYNGDLPVSITQQVASDGFEGDAAQSEAVLRYWHQPDISIFGLKLDISALFFSLTTFVTLGYGDFAPTGWFKFATGIEALLGVGLVALFTVAWGRKLVR